MIIVIDGPAGSGKSSTAKAVAKKMNIAYLDSGALYRALTWIYLQADQDKKSFFEKLNQASISFFYTDELFHVVINGNDITDQLRNSEVANSVSLVASFPHSRIFVNDLMREAVKNGKYIAEGRDLGTAVFPDATLKFFMVADTEVRARRRFEELKAAGSGITIEQVRENIRDRDEKDTNRDADPLKKADDAIEIDTTEMGFDEQIEHICSIISDQTELKLTS